MTDDLITRLQSAGDLLDRRGEESLGVAGDDDGLRVFPIAPPAPARGRRGQGVLAAAAAAFVVALVGAVAWNGSEQPLGVASGGETFALVPSSGIERWDRLEVSNEALEPMEYGSILVSPAGDSDITEHEQLARSMNVSVMPYEWFEGGYIDAGWKPVSTADIAGHVSPGSVDGEQRMMGTEQRMLLTEPVETEAGLMTVQVTASAYAASDEMLALAALVDPEVPIEEQEIEGWEVLMRYNASRLGGHARSATLIGDDGSFISITTLTGVADEAALVLVSPYGADPVEVRGHPGWSAGWGSTISLTWVEAPGVVVQLTFSGHRPDAQADPEVLLADALALAEDLVAVDASGWADLAAQATVRPDDAPITTTSLPSGTATFEGRVDAVVPGQTADGREYTVWSTDGRICWSFAGQSGHDCEVEEAHHLDGPDHALPRLAADPDDQLAFVYGFLPIDASSVQVSFQPVSVEARTQGPVRDAGFSRAGRLWVTAIPAGYQADLVSYFDDAGQVIESHEADAATGWFHR